MLIGEACVGEVVRAAALAALDQEALGGLSVGLVELLGEGEDEGED